MAEVLPLSESELELLASITRHKVRFLLVGLSAAALQGAPVVTQDVDLWFENLSDPRLTEALVEVHAAYVPPFGINPPMLVGQGAEPFDVVLRMDGLKSFEAEYKAAIQMVVGSIRLKVLPLARVLASKVAANRPKDKIVLKVLEDVLVSDKYRKTRSAARKRASRAKKPGGPI